MVEIYRDALGAFDVKYGYRIFRLEDKVMFDYIAKLYTGNNKWGKEQILSDVIIHRLELLDVLDYLGTSRNILEIALKEDFSNALAVGEAIDSMEKKMVITLSLNQAPVSLNGEGGGSCPVKVFINNQDYSSKFQGFGVYEDRIVDEVYAVLTQDNYPASLSCLGEFEQVFVQNIESMNEPVI